MVNKKAQRLGMAAVIIILLLLVFTLWFLWYTGHLREIMLRIIKGLWRK